MNMKTLGKLTIVLIVIGLFGATFANAQKYSAKRRNSKAKITKNKQMPKRQTTAIENQQIKILASGLQGNIEETFIFAARDAETYELIKKWVPELPEAREIDFKTNAVIAAFLGTKPTAGFEVEITKSANNNFKVETMGVPSGAMVAQVLTTPFKVALVPVKQENALGIQLGSDWTNAMQTFRIASGEFSFSGGSAPIEKKFQLDGTLNFWRAGDLVTIDFNASGKGAEKSRKLSEIASGVFTGNSFTLMRMDAGNFVDPPHPALKVTGEMNGNKISLVFESLPTVYSDGYEGKGRLEAVK